MAGECTVLIADADPGVVEQVRVTLEETRLRVVEARNGRMALTLAEAFLPDLVLLDADLPGLSGLEVYVELRSDSRYNDATIAILRASRPGESVTCHHGGGDCWLTKPMSRLALMSVAEHALPAAVLWWTSPAASRQRGDSGRCCAS